MAPQRKKARETKEDQPKSAEAEVVAVPEVEQEDVVQMRDSDESSATEAGHARAKAGADIALSLSAEYRD